MSTNAQEAASLPPLAQAIVDRAIDNAHSKLIAGYRNRSISRPGAKTVDLSSTAKDALEASSASSVQAVANRGAAWREMFQKSLTHGISSLSTLKFDGEFTIENGAAVGLEAVPNTPGVYVVFNKQGQAMYVGDSVKLQKRWHSGHLNEHKQGKQSAKAYKLAQEFEEGCTVKYIKMESEATAAALEAHLIRTEAPEKNSREELANAQGKRTNIEAKKMKDTSGSAAKLAMGAGLDALGNSAWAVFEQLSAAVLKALKDELVDIVIGTARTIRLRLKRFFDKVWAVVQSIIDAPYKLLAGFFEFIVNAVSKTIAQFCKLARNILDLGQVAWQLFHGSKTMSAEELVQKVSETVILSGTLILWDALDPVLEAKLATVVGPLAPFLSAAICAIGYGLSSHHLQKVVPSIVRFVVDAKAGPQGLLIEQRLACEQLIQAYESEFRLLDALEHFAVESFRLEHETKRQIRVLEAHTPIAAWDVRSLLAFDKGGTP